MKKIFYENLKLSNFSNIKKIKQELNKVADSGNFILGKNTQIFEKNFSKYNKSKYCVGVGNGLDALTISLKTLNLKKNSEVLVPSNAYIACILSILNSGLKPKLVEPNIDTYNLDAEGILKNITKKTKAILALHLYGKPCEIDKIKKICDDKKIFLIEDCAQAHGAKINNKMVGTFGRMGCFSFYPTKNLGAFGDAGAIILNDKKTFDKLVMMRNYGSSKRYQNDIIGVNSRLDEMQSVILNVKLKQLKYYNAHKNKIARLYDKNLNDNYIKPKRLSNMYEVHYIYNIRHPKRDKIKKILEEKNILTDIHYPIPPYRQKSLSKFFKKNYPISDCLSKTTLSLPISFGHKINDIYRVIEVMNKIKL